MKVILFLVCLTILSPYSAKTIKKMRNTEAAERNLSDMGINGSSEQFLDNNDSNAIYNAASRMASLVDRVNRLKVKLQRELQTTVSYLRYHFNQRDVFDKRVMMQHLASLSAGTSVSRERKLIDQPMLKDYGKISEEVKNENFDAVKAPAAADNSELAKN